MGLFVSYCVAYWLSKLEHIVASHGGRADGSNPIQSRFATVGIAPSE